MKEEAEENMMFFSVLKQTPRPKSHPHGEEGHHKHDREHLGDDDKGHSEFTLDEVGSIPPVC